MKSRAVSPGLMPSLCRLASIVLMLALAYAAPRATEAQAAPVAARTGKSAVPAEDPEVKLGREAAEENDKHVKLITDSAIVDRVNRIGQTIAAVANTTPIPALFGSSTLKKFDFTFKVVDDKDVNAYSLPGGFVYVNKGLLDFVHSDDELAGVLAHEIGHVMHHHVLKLLHEQNKIQNILTPLQIAAIGMILANRGSNSNGGNVLAGAQVLGLYQTAKMNGFSVNAEKDADHVGLLLLTHTHYNPVGLYAAMVHIASYERNHGPAELGIFRDHPPGPERVAAAKKLLDDLHIPIYLSEVDPAWRAVVTPMKVGDGDAAQITVHGVSVCCLVAANGMTAQERATKLANHLDYLIDRQLEPFEIRVSPDQSVVTARGVTVLTAADAAAQGKTLDALAHEVGGAITEIIQKQQLELSL